MVQIIGEDNSLKKRVTCGNCASILEYTNSELQEKTFSDYTGSRDTVKILVCPKCSNDIHVR